MGTSTYFPDGSVLVSSALTTSQLNVILQPLIAQILGILIAPITVDGTVTEGSNLITDVTPGGYYKGCSISGTGIPLGASIIGVSGNTVAMNAAATSDVGYGGGGYGEGLYGGAVILSIVDPNPWHKVRIAWQPKGQPGFTFEQDVCTIRCTEVELAYNQIRNVSQSPNDSVSVTKTTTYQRTWEVFLSLYGPNSFDHARVIKSALFLDWTHDTLATSNLYLVPDMPRTVRAPELIDGQWQERSDFRFQLNEGVTETITVPTVTSVEVQAYTSSGKFLDETISFSQE